MTHTYKVGNYASPPRGWSSSAWEVDLFSPIGQLLLPNGLRIFFFSFVILVLLVRAYGLEVLLYLSKYKV